MSYANYIQEYHHKIQTGEIVAGKWIKLLYDKIVTGLRDGLFYFDDKKAKRAIRFIETFCHHCEGRNDLITLELWQKSTVCLMFGIVDADGLRIFREVFLVMGRKKRKEPLCLCSHRVHGLSGWRVWRESLLSGPEIGAGGHRVR